jgi:predicted MPP superfamily phosphohydrolase
MNRRKFIKGISAFGALGLFTGLYAWQIEPFWLEFVHLKMPVKHLPKKLIGSTLMQISDLHVGNRFDRKFIMNSFKKAKEYKPEFVVYTGDFVSYDSEEQLVQLEEVMQDVVLGTKGTIAILGNHDYGKNWSEPYVADKIAAILRAKGVQVLRNEQQSIDGLNFIGLDDYWGTNYFPLKVLKNLNLDTANIALSHNPDTVDHEIWNNYDSWILSGHTHGGQCKPPFLPPPMLPVKNRRYNSGKIDLADGRILYINRALGHLWQVRFNVRPEITLFELDEVSV